MADLVKQHLKRNLAQAELAGDEEWAKAVKAKLRPPKKKAPAKKAKAAEGTDKENTDGDSE